MTSWTRSGGIVGLALLATVSTHQAAAQSGEALYTCVDPTQTRELDIGITVCEAEATDTLRARLEPDNLQLREGVLVTDVTADGIGGTAGLLPGDVIYRVGGTDVSDDVETAARFSLIADDADSLVNFLRLGRPYRIKIRER